THLPKEIIQLKNLKLLFLDGNPLIEPPLEIAVKGKDAIFSYFHTKYTNTTNIEPSQPNSLDTQSLENVTLYTKQR
ncbi:MAG: hypothetical protein P8I98_08695, partial [Nitrospinaceae bacterium]|nr:hypothetical protein [Nitrospinaceae bacterium]